MLIDEMMEDCCLMDRVSVPDGEGGWDYTWKAGAPFKAAIVKDTSLNARIAEKEGVTEVYTITVYKGNKLNYNDVIKRLKDDTVLKVTSNIDDSETPKRASFQIGQVSAKRWELE